jgi:superfamily II DNA/RNA helicase
MQDFNRRPASAGTNYNTSSRPGSPSRPSGFSKPSGERPYNPARPQASRYGSSKSRTGGFGGGSSNGRSGFGGRSSFGGGRPSGRGGFGGGSRRPARGVRGAEYIDETKFVKKAIEVKLQEAYKHNFIFPELQVNSALKANILKKGYNIPTPIQDQTIPMIMEGNDVVGVANTGTGKTAAFLIPLIEKVNNDRRQKVLIIVPTRELAEQINDELYLLTKNMRIFSVRVIGGNGISGQIRSIRAGFNFIIGTPGRLKDLMERRVLNMSVFQNIVLDEVDRMLDMGFIDEIKNIISLLPKEKQSLFFSATLDTKIDALIRTILKPDYKKVSVVQGSTSQNINQDVIYFKDYEEKQTKLKELVEAKKDQKVLVFVNTKREVDRIDKMLYDCKFSVDSIHGDKRQNMRKRAIDNFKAGQTDILIATDVAARGLDIPKVALVINYDIPNNYQDYIHRIGRTGRANEIGDALTFVRKSVY